MVEYNICSCSVMNGEQEFYSISLVCVCEGPLRGNRKLEPVVNKPHLH